MALKQQVVEWKEVPASDDDLVDAATTPTLTGNTAAAPALSSSSRVVSVTDFGADPSGDTLSDGAFAAAIAMLLSFAVPGRHLASNISDLGGAVLDLQGGEYLISRPIAVPGWYGNFAIKTGSLIAAKNFSQDRFLIEVGVPTNECKAVDPGQKSCNEDIYLSELLLDGGMVAAGCVQINATMGGNVGPDVYFLHFAKTGAEVNGGHEVMIHEAWAGHKFYDEKNKTVNTTGTTGIVLNGNDHVLSDIIVFAAETGIANHGGANLITGVHTWNQATAQGGMGIVVDAPGSVRLDKVYLDFTSLELTDPTHASVTNSFFLGMGTLILKAVSGTVDGLTLVANQWANFKMPHNRTIVLDERGGATFTSVKDFVMLGNLGSDSMTAVAVTATHTLPYHTDSHFEFDFAPQLLFPNVELTEQSYSISLGRNEQGFVQHAMREPAASSTRNGGGAGAAPHVAVVADKAVNASVYFRVSQSANSPGNS